MRSCSLGQVMSVNQTWQGQRGHLISGASFLLLFLTITTTESHSEQIFSQNSQKIAKACIETNK